jgi:predicted transcriptional regulator of viral defense system
MKNLNDYLKLIRMNGKYHFTSEDAIQALGISRNALACAIYKLKRKGDIVSPAKGLYIIVPPEHQTMGSLPPEDLAPILMQYWEIKSYYAGLLTAALFHGAAHQKPQVFQIITSKQIRSLKLGKIKIEFIYKKDLAELPFEQRTVKTGYLMLSSPELTAMDLFLYPSHAGGLNNAATVLSELIEKIDAEKLIALEKNNHSLTWLQRLGYVLENIDSDSPEKQKILLKKLRTHITKKSLQFAPLATQYPEQNVNKNETWKIIENIKIESDA